MKQQTMFDVPEKLDYTGLVRSLSFEQSEIIKGIMHLHNNGQPFDADITYSKGVFWNNIPQPKYKFDLLPQVNDCIPARAEHLPLDNDCLQSIMFDPPFVIKDVVDRKPTGVIEKRFFAYKSNDLLWNFYKDALCEGWRVLKDGGIFVFKCQDTLSGGKQYMSHHIVMGMAEKAGYYCKDLFILGNRNVLWSPNMINQQHARKVHSYFIVFQKRPAVLTPFSPDRGKPAGETNR